MKKIIKVAVLGCTGFTGLELINILIQHPNVSINFLGSQNNAGKYISTLDKRLAKPNLPKLDYIKNLNFNDIDVVFFALPHNISQSIIKKNFNKCVLIDLSADFRLDNSNDYKKNYKNEHLCPELLEHFVYGLPEIYSQKIKVSKNVAVPGCYPTSVLLPLIPLIDDKLILQNNIIIDSKSGYSGAGKKFNTEKLFNKNKLNFYNYNTNNHRHIVEISQELNKFSKYEVKFSFNPHILPIFRGMMSTIYCELNNGISKNDINNCLVKKFSKSNFIKILDINEPADFFTIYKSKFCLLKLFDHYENNKIIIVSLIDNLLKGASSQAIQCMNIIFSLDEKIGLVDFNND